MNRAAEGILGQNDGLVGDADGLAASTVHETRELRSRIAGAALTARGIGVSAGGCLPIARPSGKRPFAVVVTPVSIHAFAPDARQPAAMVFVSDPELKAHAPVEILEQLYQLTAAEARLAGLLMQGPLREKLLPKPLQSSFQKAVAMVDQPDVSYEHFARLLFALRAPVVKDKDRIRVARQINICLWVLFVWAREIDNLEAPYRASELALLHVWDLLKPFIGKKGAQTVAMASALDQLVLLHTIATRLFLERKILPFVNRQHALSFAVNSAEPTDVNLKMFDTLGRLALAGHWMIWWGRRGGRDLNDEQIAGLRKHVTDGFNMIANNPSLFLPLKDEHAIEVALFLSLANQMGHARADIVAWLSEMVHRLRIAVASHG
ncbi:MAG: hypothetical protein ABSF22_11070, partial [Bryobacteraceae bacterium]